MELQAEGAIEAKTARVLSATASPTVGGRRGQPEVAARRPRELERLQLMMGTLNFEQGIRQE